MKVEGYHPPKSRFLSIEKDLGIITTQMVQNQRLKKLLHYTTRDALSKPALSADESLLLFGKNIKLIPKLYVDNSVLNFISFSNFL